MKKILLVDDDVFKKVLKMVLVPMGYEVLMANNGIEGHALVDQHKGEIALVFLDMMMPGMDGLRFLKILREEKQLDIPVVAMSSVTDEKIIEDVKDLGVVEYFIKPIKANQIKEKVQEILGD